MRLLCIAAQGTPYGHITVNGKTPSMDDLAKLGAAPLRIDISREQEIKSAVGAIMGEVGGVDVLINNAGFGLYGAVEDISVDEARYQFGMNVSGPARLRHLVLPAMRVKGLGLIVNITSMGGKVYTLLGAWYHARRTNRTRYVAGKYAKPMIMMRHWLGDRMFDRLVMSQMT